MKKALIIILLLCPFLVNAQAIPGCGPYTSHAVYNLNGVSNQTIHDVVIDAANGLYGIKLVNCNNIHIYRVKIVNQKAVLPDYSGAIDITNSTNVKIDTVYIANSAYGVLCHPISLSPTVVKSNMAGLSIKHNYFYNIHTDSLVNGNGASVQLNNCTGEMHVDSNKSYSPFPNPGIGDQYSFFQCDGLLAHYITCDGNEIIGGSTNTTGKAGFILGDVGGSYQEASGNLMVNPGASAFLVQGGHDIIMNNNSAYSDGSNTSTTVGMAYGNFSGSSSFNITIGGNKLNWKKHSDASISNKFYFTNHGEAQPTNWTTNSGDHIADLSITSSLVSFPLFSACPTPPIISYTPNTNVYITGTAITTKVPANSGGSVVSWSINKSLPAGLSFSTSTGNISGTPTATHLADNYIVTATNTAGSSNTTINITVNAPLAVPAFTYSPSSNTYVTGTTITNKMPISTGGTIASYSINRSLPAGLFFNTGSGLISGTPTAISTNTAYVITGTNASGSSTFTINITVNAPIVSVPNISYAPSSNTFTYGITIPNLLPTNSGGTIASFSISPSLPSGLSFNTTTGLISGTPTAPHAVTNYTVTATNAGGNSTFVVSITIQKAPLVIIAVSTSKLPGHANPTFDVIYGGFKFSDSSASLSTLPTVTTNAVTLSPPGVYPLVPGGAVSSNYSFSYISGVLLIGTGPVISGSFGGIIRLSE